MQGLFLIMGGHVPGLPPSLCLCPRKCLGRPGAWDLYRTYSISISPAESIYYSLQLFIVHGNVWGAQVHGTHTEHIVYLFHLQNPYTIAYNYLLFMEMFGVPGAWDPYRTYSISISPAESIC